MYINWETSHPVAIGEDDRQRMIRDVCKRAVNESEDYCSISTGDAKIEAKFRDGVVFVTEYTMKRWGTILAREAIQG